MTDKPKSSGKIIRSFICEKCGMEFNNDKEYKQHKVDHTLGKAFPDVDPVSGEPKPDPNQPQEAPIQPVEPPKPTNTHDWPSKPTEITLKYVYTGICPSCNSQVNTIPLDVGKKHFVIAWCSKCSKNIQQRSVAKL